MRKVLVVDDNLLALRQMEVHLSPQYEVILAKSGYTAVHICKTEKPDIIILDIQMSQMDGLQTITEIKKLPGLESVPFLFLTGSRDGAVEARCRKLGAVDFLTKPVNKNVMLSRLEQCL
jgi:putative two-component system response regulator